MAHLTSLLRALGHRVHEHEGIDWVEVGSFSLMATPSTALVPTTNASVERLLRETGKLAATFVTDDRGVAATAWWVRDPAFDAGSAQRQFRQHLRRGAGRTVIRPIDWEEFRVRGWTVHRDVATARGTTGLPTLTATGWQRLCDVAEATAGLEATGCFVDGTLAAFIVSVTTDGDCAGVLADVSPRHADLRPAHALYHGFAAMMIRRPGIRGVTVGRQGIPARRSLDAFKRHAGFGAESVRVAVVIHPRWRPMITSATVRGCLRAAERLCGNRVPALENTALLDAAAMTWQAAGGPRP